MKDLKADQVKKSYLTTEITRLATAWPMNVKTAVTGNNFPASRHQNLT
jgi:hypothetical protein